MDGRTELEAAVKTLGKDIATDPRFLSFLGRFWAAKDAIRSYERLGDEPNGKSLILLYDLQVIRIVGPKDGAE